MVNPLTGRMLPDDTDRQILNRLIERSNDLFFRFELHPKRGFSYVNPAASGLTGYTPEAFYGNPDLETRLVHPDDRPLAESVFRGEVKADQLLDLRWVRADGAVIWIRQQVEPEFDPEGRLIAVEGHARDITAQKQAEDAVRRSEARLHNILSNASEAIITIDENEDLTLFNESAQRMFGWPAGEIIGRPLSVLLPPDFVEVHHEHVKAFAQSPETVRHMDSRPTVPCLRKDGGEFLAEIGISRHVEEGRAYFTAIVVDVTERVRAREEILRMVERFQALTGDAPGETQPDNPSL